jgi:hypothetical protein
MSESIPRRQFATALGGMMAGVGGLSAAAQGTTTQAQISTVTRVGCLNTLQFPTSVALESFEKILRSFKLSYPSRNKILQAFSRLLEQLDNVIQTQQSSAGIYDALFDLNTVIGQSDLPQPAASILFASATGIFCSLVCSPTPSGAAPGFQYILKDWFVSDFEFRLDTCRVQVTCIYTCKPLI